MNEESLRAILRDPSYPQELRMVAFRCIVQQSSRERFTAAIDAIRRLRSLLYDAADVARGQLVVVR